MKAEQSNPYANHPALRPGETCPICHTEYIEGVITVAVVDSEGHAWGHPTVLA